MSSTTPLPPMLAQYVEYKEKYPDALLFMQVGDFYEVFFSDAETVAGTLGLTLTSRDKNSANPIPMCGVPVAVIDGYIERLVNQGFSAAIVSQSGPVPPKGMVPRALDRIITPGVRLLGSQPSLEASAAVVAALLVVSPIEAHLAWTNINDGTVWVRSGLPTQQIVAELERAICRELVVCRFSGDEVLDGRSGLLRDLERRLNIPIKLRGMHYLEEAGLGVVLSGVESQPPGTRKAITLLLHYLAETTVDIKATLASVATRQYNEILSIDAETRRSLELVANQRDGTKRGTLFAHLDETVTVGGGAMLWDWVLHPLTQAAVIVARHESVEVLGREESIRCSLRSRLKGAPPLARLAARIASRVASPRELGAIRDLLLVLPDIALDLSNCCANTPLLSHLAAQCIVPHELTNMLVSTLADEIPAVLKDGGLIRAGYSEEVDALRALTLESTSWISAFELQERERTGIPSLKIKQNGVLGYFIEVTQTHVSRVPSDYIRRQSTAQADRFTLPSLQTKEDEVVRAQGRLLARERQIFESLRDALLPYVGVLRGLDATLSTLDVLLSFAVVASNHRYIRPVILDSDALNVVEGRHPVVAARLGAKFIPNSLAFGASASLQQQGAEQSRERVAVLTGPNMGGKSTFLRQVALIVVMAQMGSFVPAGVCEFGIVDAIFARIGSADDIHEGESTFMVEMREAAAILANATSRSLVLIDEIGRGTGTRDGFALAQSILEWLTVAVNCKTIFATHFHELTELLGELPTLMCLAVGVREEADGPVFTHEITAGAATQSYGLEVARLAGLPDEVLARAEALAVQRGSVEDATPRPSIPRDDAVVSLASKINENGNRAQEERSFRVLQAISEKLSSIDLFKTTPIAALGYLQEVQKLVDDGYGSAIAIKNTPPGVSLPLFLHGRVGGGSSS